MEYPALNAIIDHLLAGLKASENRARDIEQRVSDAINALPEAKRATLTVNMLLRGANDGVSLSRELRTMMASPGFKIEPIISELRRAEAGYIASHDEFLADPTNGLRIDEMRWAHARLQITRQFYNGLIASLPKKTRVVKDRNKVKSTIAIKLLRLAEFSEEEQMALRHAVVDRAKAIALLDAIISEDRASSDDVRIMHAWLVDPDAAKFDRWLTNELAQSRSSTSETVVDAKEFEEELREKRLPAEPALIRAGNDAAVSATMSPDNEPATIAPTMDADIARDICTVETFCRKQSWAILKLDADRYGLKSSITRRDILSAFERVRDHPAMQNALRALAARKPAQVQADKDGR